MADVIGLRGAVKPPCDVEDTEDVPEFATVDPSPDNWSCLVILAACVALWAGIIWGAFALFSGIFTRL